MKSVFRLVGFTSLLAGISFAVAEPAGSAKGSSPAPVGCSLVTEAEIEEIQGEKPKEAQNIQHTEGGLSISQCNYVLPTHEHFVVVRVVRKAPGENGREPREVWNETFSAEARKELERKRARRRPEEVKNVGEQAFWVGDAKTGVLYVLKRDVFIRVGLGGSGNIPEKIKKCSALARKALARL